MSQVIELNTKYLSIVWFLGSQIGLMRGGKLLAEESPARLLELFHTDTLEEVFLILSKNQEEGRINRALEAANNPDHNANRVIDNASSTTSVATFDIGYSSKEVCGLFLTCKLLKLIFFRS